MFFILLFTLLARAQARAVFAHFMVGNAAEYSVIDWQNEMAMAMGAHIDAFALNIANGDSHNTVSIANAFQAAQTVGFKLFFSFDYAGNGPWNQNDVIALLNQYKSSPAHFRRGEQPLVSTVEGPDHSQDWYYIKQQTGVFFVPDWSSYGPQKAIAQGTADGLFSWSAWQDVDASYVSALAGKPYMMAVSPWFYTNLPGYNKNWVWSVDWFARWQKVMEIMPEYVEIISWNDFGESHYIGPLVDKAMGAFQGGKAPFNYATNMPHDAWRMFLPYLIDSYKSEKPVIQEGITYWYRPEVSCGSTGGTTGNTASQGQVEVAPSVLLKDAFFVAALLQSPATATVTIGGRVLPVVWTTAPSGAGLYHGYVLMDGATGPVTVSVQRGSLAIAAGGGPAVGACANGVQNFNAWVGGEWARR